MNTRYVVKRILYSFLILFIVITLNFFLPRLVFEDPAEPFLRGIPDDEFMLRNAVRKEFGFDKPVWVQFLVYLKKFVTFDFGTSYIYKQPVFKVMFDRIPWSMVLSVAGMLISIVAGIVWGATASTKRGKAVDNALLNYATITTAIPSFWVALVFVMLFAFAVPIFPYRGAMTDGYSLSINKAVFFGVAAGAVALTVVLYKLLKKPLIVFVTPLAGLIAAVFAAVPASDIADIAYHAALPLIVICLGSIVSYALMVRNSMIAVVNEDYILTARAKGLDKTRVLYGHTMRNALLPMVTSIGMSLAGIFGGSVLLEKIFTWPGMGTLLLEAQNIGDFQLAQAIMFFYSFITIFANLLTDFVYHKLDPRIKAE
ncbi:MAG: ABC transporter permease [Clostridiales bacterium]|jgi:peptide/nickel transport system permease protein|nr:ABC transporter permease [Clostridiales bacterium]